MATGELVDRRHEVPNETPPTDVVFTALSNRRRRLVVQVLREATEPMDIGTLATRIAALENDIEPEMVSHRQRKSVYTSLHQNHLPRLTDAGFVTADREWVDIQLTEKATVLEVHLGDGDADRTTQLSAAFASGFSATAVISLYPGSGISSALLAMGAAICGTLVCYWIVTDFAHQGLLNRR